MNKEEIRRFVRNLRSEQDKAEIIRKSSMITGNLFDLQELRPDFLSGKNVALFKSFDGEPDMDDAYKKLDHNGAICFFPVIKAGRLYMRVPGSENSDDDRFHRGELGILEPAGSDYSFTAMDIVLIPGIAFSETGNRIGFGKGYYDKYLAEYYPEDLPLIIAPVFDFQIISGIIAESHDIPVDIIVTESKIIRPGKL